jgi:hypothetical protein
MGLFSSSTKVYVASTAYNMSGDADSRINYLKTTVSRSVLTNAPSIAESIISAQLYGPIMSQRSWFRWSNSHYPEGQISGSTTNRQLLTEAHRDTIKSFIPTPAEGVIEVTVAFIDNAEISMFAERFFLANKYDLYGTNWFSDYDSTSDKMKIIYEDLSEELITVSDFKDRSDFMYVYYSKVSEKVYSTPVTDAKVLNLTSEPDLTGADPAWTQDSLVPESIVETLTTTVTTVDHTTDPDTESSSTSSRNESVDDALGVHTRLVDMGYTDGSQDTTLHEDQELTIWKEHRIITVETVDDSDPNQTVTTQEEQIEEYWETQLETQEIRQDAARKDDMFIYEMGSGNADLDSLQVASAAIPEFYPFIPLRYNNLYVSESPYDVDYPSHVEAYKKVIGGDIQETLLSIDDNPSVGDIDHAFLTFGVELNTEERAGRRYIYEFMKGLISHQNDVDTGDVAWEANNDYFTYYNDYLEWSTDQADVGSPRYGDPEPTAVAFPVPRISVLSLKNTSDTTPIKYNVAIEWVYITENFRSGKGKVEAVANDFWWEAQDTTYNTPGSLEAYAASQLKIEALGLTHSRLYWQVTDDVYSYIDLFGMTHVNRIYQGKSVQLNTKESLEDLEPSGFVVPMHYPTIQNVPLVLANELANSNKIIVFNSYQVVTTRWYQKGIFKVIIMVIIAVIIALVYPPAAPGLLGSNAFVGASLGFAAGSTAAIAAGAAANAIAAIVLTQAISTVSIELFGEKWGKLIAAIVTVMVGSMTSNYQQTGNFSMDWGKFMRVDNLIGMTDSVATGVQGYAAYKNAGIEEDMAEAREEYEDDVQSIIKKMEELGHSGVDLDPLMFIQQDNSDNRNVTSEPSANFLRRTLLTGSDIAEMTHAMIDDFVEISLTLPEANG